MKNGSKFFIFLIAITTLILFFGSKKEVVSDRTLPPVDQSTQVEVKAEIPAFTTIATPAQAKPVSKAQPRVETSLKSLPSRRNEKSNTLHFVVTDDGLVTVDADIVLGSLQGSDATSGLIEAPSIELWPTSRIPFLIQGHLENPDRVFQALKMFEDAPVQLVPENGEFDVLVFEPAAKGCKSYVGRVGGKQPIWLGPECGSLEIAHEIMHALGFIHEQNRVDRDAYVKINWNNITPSAKINFEKFPSSMMLVSGGAAFDYRSIMIYPPTTFALNASEETMLPTNNRDVIEPSDGLSLGDVIRLGNVYK